MLKKILSLKRDISIILFFTIILLSVMSLYTHNTVYSDNYFKEDVVEIIKTPLTDISGVEIDTTVQIEDSVDDESSNDVEPETTVPQSETVEEVKTEIKVYDSVIDDIVYRGNCTDTEWNMAVNYWYQMPSALRNSFKENGWTMKVTNDDFWSENGYAGLSIAALTVYTQKTVYIHASHMRASTIGHEMGHYLDYIYGFPSQTEEFYQLFVSEKDGFTEWDSRGDQSKGSAIEYFAAIMSQIISAPSTEATALNSFAYVKQYVFW